MNTEQQLGYELAKGACLYLSKVFCIGLLLAWVITVALNWLNVGTDDSDKDGFNRSGLAVLTDHKTGIEYLSDGKGGLIKREPKQPK